MREDEGILTVTVERYMYDDTEGHIVVLIATSPMKGTANGNFKPCMDDHYNILMNLCNKGVDLNQRVGRLSIGIH